MKSTRLLTLGTRGTRTPASDFNDKMLSIHEATGATFGKRHATMRKLFK